MSRVFCVIGERWTKDDIKYHSIAQHHWTETLRFFFTFLY